MLSVFARNPARVAGMRWRDNTIFSASPSSAITKISAVSGRWSVKAYQMLQCMLAASAGAATQASAGEGAMPANLALTSVVQRWSSPDEVVGGPYPLPYDSDALGFFISTSVSGLSGTNDGLVSW